MFPPIEALTKNDVAVQAVLGSNPVRVFIFGQAPQDVATPYAVWQIISGTPENYLGQVPDIDSFTAQMDVYASTAKDMYAAVKALRDCLEPHAHITGWRSEGRDLETKRFRYGFDIDFFVPR